MLIENKCVPCTWIQMIINYFTIFFIFWSTSFSSLGSVNSLHISLLPLESVWGLTLFPLVTLQGIDSRRAQILGTAASLARELSECNTTDGPLPCTKPRLSVDHRRKVELLMTLEVFHYVAPVYSLSFWLLLHPTWLFTFPQTPCIFAEIISSTRNALAVHACKVNIPSGSNSNMTFFSRKPAFLFSDAPFSVFSECCVHILLEHVSQGILNACLLM